MEVEKRPFDMSKELATLKHEKKNHELHRLPSNATIQRRPVHHAPVASPYAGANVQKVVYVSTKTPIMSAVKRVKKLLHHIEKRATQHVSLIGRGDKIGLRQLADAREELVKDGEEVLVKASGRAMEQALRVGEWFRSKEKEMLCNVEVRTGSVSVIDDIVEVEQDENEESKKRSQQQEANDTTMPDGDTTMEILADIAKPIIDREQEKRPKTLSTQPDEASVPSETGKLVTSRKRKRNKRPMYDKDDLPEARLRWIKTVEVAISLKG